MNLLSLMRYEYQILCVDVPDASGYQVTMYGTAHNDTDSYKKLTKIELENLRDNAKRLFQACNNALPKDEQI